jgi:predicted nucleic acid-binding protein
LAERVFIDTNILIYADDDDAGARRDAARSRLHALIAEERAVLSTQVLQEYFAVATRKLGLARRASGSRSWPSSTS